jgi:hypothetical protein
LLIKNSGASRREIAKLCLHVAGLFEIWSLNPDERSETGGRHPEERPLGRVSKDGCGECNSSFEAHRRRLALQDDGAVVISSEKF